MTDVTQTRKTSNEDSESAIKTVGVVGTGVIGASWTALFLAKGEIDAASHQPGSRLTYFTIRLMFALLSRRPSSHRQRPCSRRI